MTTWGSYLKAAVATVPGPKHFDWDLDPACSGVRPRQRVQTLRGMQAAVASMEATQHHLATKED